MKLEMERRARRMVERLEIAADNSGFLVSQGTIVMRCPSAEADTPTPYDEADLNNAIELNLLEERSTNEKRNGVEVPEWVYYTLPRPTKK